MNRIILVLTALIIIPLTLFSQKQLNHHEEDEHHTHAHHKNEFGIAQAPVYFVNEEELAYGLHLHLIHFINGGSFGIGLGYERIFDEHGHNTFGVVGSYRFTHDLSVNLSPGLTFEDEAPDEINFAFHVEWLYEFEFGNFHLGPVLEFAYDPEDYHVSLGIHLGYGF